MDTVEEDLKIVRMNNLKNIIDSREKWREVVMMVKTLVEQIKPEEEEEDFLFS